MTQERDLFSGGSGTGRLMAALDWAATPIGPVEAWPQSLRVAVGIVLSSRYPMLLLWGEEYTQLYNDAYSELIGDRHPAALGHDVRVTLAEGWPVLAPIVDGAMATGVASWVPALQLLLIRSGYREEAYFSVSHAPARDDDGVTRGVLTVCSEVTEQVIGERRLRLLRELSVSTGPTATVAQTAALLADTIAASPLDVPFAALYLTDGDSLRRVAPGSGPLPERVAVGERDRWGLGQAATGRSSHVRDPAGLAGAHGGPWDDPVTDALALPLGTDEAGRALGVALVGVSPARALDEAYRSFFELLAQQVGGALRTALAYEQERARAEALAELDRVKTRFFTNVSHEFRTPLTLMLGPLTDALADLQVPLDQRQHERIETARRGATRMLKLVDNLLTFAGLEAGAPRGPVEAVDLAALTADVASGFRSAVERAGLSFTVDCPPLPRPVGVQAEDWETLVTNLISNALKFTFVGSITVTVDEGPAGARLRVADTGIGIAPADLAKLFERFRRVHGSRARSHEGSGIGLALVRELARLHGGDVEVASTPGAGTTFTVTMPWAPPGAVPALVAAPTSRTVGAALEEAAGWLTADPLPPAAPARAGRSDGFRVLVADDNADMRAYLVRLLAAEGWQVEAVADGAAALDAAVLRRPDLLLTDVMMPELDGFELVRRLRREARTATMPIVVLSARAGQEAAVEGLDLGADDYVTKPFASADLVARLRTTMQLARLRGTHAAQLRTLADTASELTADRGLEESLRVVAAQARSLLGGRAAVLALDPVDGRPPLQVTEPPLPGDPAPAEDVVAVDVRGRDGRVLGTLAVHVGPGRRTPGDEAILEPVARMVAALVEGSLRFGRAHEVATALQRSLLPDRLPDVAGLELAWRYLPAASDMRVGGDWYDVVELPDGAVALSVGDVAGHGLPAAVVMGQLRAAARAHCLAGAAPAEVVVRLDELVAAMPDAVLATFLLIRLDPRTGDLCWCSAGHPPALVADATGVRPLDGPVQPPLGTGVRRVEDDTAAQLPDGAYLLLYTDGLVEDREHQLDVGPDQLRGRLQAALGAPREPLSAAGLVEAAMGAPDVPAGDRHDDVAVLALRRATAGTRSAAPAVETDVRLRYPSEPAAAGTMRRDLRRVLGEAGVPDDALSDLLLAASEAFNNAVEHAHDPRRPEVEVSVHVRGGEAVLRVRDHGTWRPRRSSMDRGHGSSLMSAAGHVHIGPGPEGTVVTIRRRLAT